MTPKEKAQELIKKFSFNTRCFSETKGWEDSFFDAKECALIAVDEILSEYWSHNTERRDWWKQVKQEIEKL
jgi:hypothetical protein